MDESNVIGPFYWQCACAVSRNRVVGIGGHPKPHLESATPICLFTI